MSTPPKEHITYYCEECGGTKVSASFWLDLNTDEVLGEASDDIWCDDCDNETRVTTEKPHEPRQAPRLDPLATGP